MTAVPSFPAGTLRGVQELEHTPERTLAVLRQAGAVLGLDVCWHLGDSFHFAVGDGWTIAVGPDSAARWRVQACRWTRPAVDRWVLAGDDERLAALVQDMAGEIRVAMAAHNCGGEDHAGVSNAGAPAAPGD